MKHIFAAFIILVAVSSAVIAQNSTAKVTNAVEQKFIELEKKWFSGIQRQDTAEMEQFLAGGYFLAVGVQGRPLEVVPRKDWLENLKFYKIESFSIDDIKVNVYGKTAVVLMLLTQKAMVGRPPRDRSAQFVITDIWVKQKKGWRVAERHSSRPEGQRPATEPKP